MALSFNAYIDTTGQGVISRAVGVTQPCVSAWRSGRTTPKPKQAASLVALSKGKLTFDAIYAHLMPKPKTKRKR